MQMSSLTKRSRNSKRGNSLKFNLITKCFMPMCKSVFPRIGELIYDMIPLPAVITDLIASYLKNPQHIGYVQLHKPGRRCYHVICTKCHERFICKYIDEEPLHRWNNGFMLCPHPNCSWYYNPLEISEKTVE
jgi:hypothetical protein